MGEGTDARGNIPLGQFAQPAPDDPRLVLNPDGRQLAGRISGGLALSQQTLSDPYRKPRVHRHLGRAELDLEEALDVRADVVEAHRFREEQVRERRRGSHGTGRAMDLFLSRLGRVSPTELAAWNDSQGLGILAQVGINACGQSCYIDNDNVNCRCLHRLRLLNSVARWQTLFRRPPATPNSSWS